MCTVFQELGDNNRKEGGDAPKERKGTFYHPNYLFSIKSTQKANFKFYLQND